MLCKDCNSVALPGGKYCAFHSTHVEQQKPSYKVADAPAPRKPWDGANRPNDPLYNTQRWKVLRDRVRLERGECAICGTGDNLTVHHVLPPRGDADVFYDESNLVVLCRSCHNKQTSAEQKR